ncbi:hypothetical protein CK203_036492 [Vitis vinifera]|uniref:Uncharacterized protein n=1 Tax=Vitis vinifera TaxID=29760 RepID=A0A438HZS5_VITVI|nr:hypothetical protein CK203_036492 [Vitis vinifera]
MNGSITSSHSFSASGPIVSSRASLPPQVTVEEAQEYDGPGGSGSQTLKPSFMRRFKWIGKRIVKRSPTCKSSFVVLSNLKANATSQVIMDRCRMYLDADILGRDLGTCDMMFLLV